MASTPVTIHKHPRAPYINVRVKTNPNIIVRKTRKTTSLALNAG